MAAPVTLDALITSVRTAAPDAPLAQLEQAARLKDEVGELTDALLGHFVDQARRGGASWSQIGEALGVSKQAAQQKHTPKTFSGERLTDRARICVVAAGPAARDLGHTYIGTEHLLLGLFASPEALAARVLAERDITADAVRANVLETFGRGTGDAEIAVHTPRAVKVLVGSLYVALEMGHNYIGTEHLLLSLYREADGFAAKYLEAHGLPEVDARQRIVEICLQIAASKGV